MPTNEMVESLPVLRTLLASLMMVLGAIACVAAALGVLRFPTFFARTHAAAVAGSLGAGLIILAIGVAVGELSVVLLCILGFVFIIMTAPISAHLLARSAYLVSREEPVSENEADNGLNLEEAGAGADASANASKDENG